MEQLIHSFYGEVGSVPFVNTYLRSAYFMLVRNYWNVLSNESEREFYSHCFLLILDRRILLGRPMHTHREKYLATIVDVLVIHCCITNYHTVVT